MEERKKDQQKPIKRKPNLNVDEEKQTPPGPTGYVTGGQHPSTRPEQGPDVPPQERTEGIP